MIRSSVDSLNDIPYHSHKSLKCSNPDLTYYQSYSRSFIVYKDNTVTTHSLSIPVFAVKTVIIIMHFYLHLFLFHMNRHQLVFENHRYYVGSNGVNVPESW